jgi:hypothetical protein
MTETPGKTIYNLALHERLLIGKDLGVTCVPGGWLYENNHRAMRFVPYSNEFKPFTQRLADARRAAEEWDKIDQVL